MFRLALRTAASRSWRLFTTSIAIVLGVAFVAGTAVLSDVLTRSVNDLVSSAYDGVDLIVRDQRAQDNLFSSQPIRPPIDESLADELAKVPGVAATEPIVQSFPTLLDPDGKRLSAIGPPVVAMNWLGRNGRTSGTITSGRAPTADNEMAMDFKTAKDYGFRLGQQVTVQFTSGASTFTLVGIGGGGKDGTKSVGVRVLIFPTARLQALTDQVGKVSMISIVAERGTSLSDLKSAIKKELPKHHQVVTGKQYIRETQAQLQRLLDLITNLVAAFGYIAAFVATFVIYNTFSILVAQRTREMALLRALGASRGQLLGSVLIEALLVGLLAAVVGLGVGFGLATGLKSLLGQFISVLPGLPRMTASAVESSMSLGIVVSVVSALIPAVRATRIPPVAAMTEVDLDHSATSKLRRLAGGPILIGGAALVLYGVRDRTIDNPLIPIGLGAALIVISLVVLGPLFAGPVARLLGSPLPRLLGPPGRLARENAARNPKRTTATAVALTIGVALVTVIGVIAASFNGTFSSLYGSQITADLIIDSGSQVGLGFPAAVKEQVRSVPGVTTVASTRYIGGCVLNSKVARANQERQQGASNAGCEGASAGVSSPVGETIFIVAVDAPAIFKVFKLGTIKPSANALGDNELMVSKAMMDENDWKLGDTVEISFTERRTFKIAATFDEPFAQGGYFINLATYDTIVPAPLRADANLFVKVDPDVKISTVQQRIERAIKTEAPAATVSDLGTYVREQTAQLKGLLNLVYAMLLLAVVVAVIGIWNTLALSVFERRREIGLLRAVGMTMVQVRRSVRWEAVIVSLFGTSLGVAAGLVLASASVAGFRQQGVVLTWPWTQIAIYAIGGALAGVLASVLPSRTAARTDILTAIAVR